MKIILKSSMEESTNVIPEAIQKIILTITKIYKKQIVFLP